MRYMTRILLVLIFLVPILWVWPQRGITVAFYTNSGWRNEPALLRVERQVDLAGAYPFSPLTDDGSTVAIDGSVVVDNSGVHRAKRRTATIPMTPGLHR